MPATHHCRRMFLNAFKNMFFFLKVEYLYLLSLTVLSDDTNRGQVLKFFMLFSLEEKHSISPFLFPEIRTGFLICIIPHWAVTVEQEDKVQAAVEQMSGSRKPSALGGSCTQSEVLNYCLYSAETMPCTNSCTRDLPGQCWDSLLLGEGLEQTVLLVVFGSGSQALIYFYDTLG